MRPQAFKQTYICVRLSIEILRITPPKKLFVSCQYHCIFIDYTVQFHFYGRPCIFIRGSVRQLVRRSVRSSFFSSSFSSISSLFPTIPIVVRPFVRRFVFWPNGAAGNDDCRALILEIAKVSFRFFRPPALLPIANYDHMQGRRQGVTTENFSRGPQAKGGPGGPKRPYMVGIFSSIETFSGISGI